MIRFLLPLFVLAAPLAAQPSLVILVRHAERDTAPPRDPVLTAAGTARAKALHQALAAAGVGSVITTQLQRTQLTASRWRTRSGSRRSSSRPAHP